MPGVSVLGLGILLITCFSPTHWYMADSPVEATIDQLFDKAGSKISLILNKGITSMGLVLDPPMFSAPGPKSESLFDGASRNTSARSCRAMTSLAAVKLRTEPDKDLSGSRDP